MLCAALAPACEQTHAPKSPPPAKEITPPPPPPATGPYFAHDKAWDLYIPTAFHPVNGKYDLVVHFHGMFSLEQRALDTAHLNAIVVAVNHGAWADKYQEPYRDPKALDHILAFAAAEIASSGRAPNATLGRLALSGWSAGVGSIAAILGFPGRSEQVDALLLADGLFTSYSDLKKKTMNHGPLERFVKFAEAARRNEKLFVVTHSAVPTYGYPSTIETTGLLLEMLSLERHEVDLESPLTMHQVSECHAGSFHLKGFTGTGVQAHMDHVQKMGEISWPYLRERWSGGKESTP